jgi:hypothetical protein
MKSAMYRNFAVTACSLGLLGLLVGCLGMSVSFDSTDQVGSTPTSLESHESLEKTAPIITHKQEITAKSPNSPTQTAQKRQNKPTSLLAYQLNSRTQTKKPGTLRMSNQTNQPVRLALLTRKSTTKQTPQGKVYDDIPAHWDFAPQEGSSQGLILSLPQGSLTLVKGDVLVAFAQDGSRRYWGPYVVGETPSPIWNSRSGEWQLILNP